MDLSHQLPNFIFAQTSVVMAIWRRLETCEIFIVHEGMPHSCILESEVPYYYWRDAQKLVDLIIG